MWWESAIWLRRILQPEFCSAVGAIELLWRFNVADKKKTYLGRHAKCSMGFPDLNQIRIFSAYFPKSL